MTQPKSNYARKRDFLKTQNRRANEDGDEKGGRIWGFHYPIGQKPWVKKS